jgi:uncharacterized protein
MDSVNTSHEIIEGTLPDATHGVMDSQTTSLVALLRGNLPYMLADRQVSLAYLYGSSAAGFTTTFSDIDIALLVDGGLDPYGCFSLIRHLTLALSDLLDNSNVDVRIINDAPIIFRGRVITEGILLYSCSEVERVNYETRTRQQYYDYLPVHRKLQDTFFAEIRQRGLYG